MDNRSDLEWEEVSVEHIVKDQWIDFRRSRYRFPDGSEYEPFYTYSRRDYVLIVATDEDGNYLCVRQFRQGIKEVTTEFPAGGIERKDGKQYANRQANEYPSEGQDKEVYGQNIITKDNNNSEQMDSLSEDALEAAKRELREETGYESDEWTHLISVPSNATIADNYAYIFKATNCRKVSAQDLDDTEFLNVELCSEEEITKRIYGGDFKQAIHIMAWLLAKNK